MVVLAASITTKSGKVLLSRQFVDMSRIRIEGLLAAFPKLVGTGKQHTFVETENVRYVYQPLEDLYLLLVTNKQSNILQDLDTLRLLSKLVPEYSPSMDEEGISKSAFEIIFAFDEAISLGNKENVTVAQVKQYCEMDSHGEKLHKMLMEIKINETRDVMKRKASEIDKSKIEKGRLEKGGLMSISGQRKIENSFSDMSISSIGSDIDTSSKSKGQPSATATTAPAKGTGMQLGKGKKKNRLLESLKAEGEVILEDMHVPSSARSKSAFAAAQTDPVALTVEERLNAAIKRDGGVDSFDVQGTLFLQVLNPEDGFIQLQIENKVIPGLNFKTHPNINKDLFNRERIIGLKDQNKPFPTGQNDVGLMKWRIQNLDESSLPLTVNCWPSVCGNDTYVNIEYEASDVFDLRDVVISIPLPTLRQAPSVTQIDGEWRYDSRNSFMEWSILLIDNSNRCGSMEFVVPPANASSFFPINIRFNAAKTYSNVKVTGVNPLRGETAPKYSQRIQLITDRYQIV